MEVKITKYRIRKQDGILTGLRYDNIGIAIYGIMNIVNETHKKNYKIIAHIKPKHIKEYVFVDVFTETEVKAFVRYRIEAETETTRMVEKPGDFDDKEEE